MSGFLSLALSVLLGKLLKCPECYVPCLHSENYACISL
jgi:hypothetical protein